MVGEGFVNEWVTVCESAGRISFFEISFIFGGMSEWSKEHAWKVCIPQKGIKGSNPFSSAIQTGKSTFAAQRLV